jgi:alpha-glucosidase (family GH31 glycosyl hydrolase)
MVDVPIETIPVFVRAGASIPVKLDGQQSLGGAVALSGDGDAVLRFG